RGIGLEIRHDIVLGGKAAGIDPGERHARKPVMPGGTVGDERVPSFRAPALGNPIPFANESPHTLLARVLAHGEARLPPANDERLDLFYRHVRTLLQLLGDPSRGG